MRSETREGSGALSHSRSRRADARQAPKCFPVCSQEIQSESQAQKQVFTRVEVAIEPQFHFLCGQSRGHRLRLGQHGETRGLRSGGDIENIHCGESKEILVKESLRGHLFVGRREADRQTDRLTLETQQRARGFKQCLYVCNGELKKISFRFFIFFNPTESFLTAFFFNLPTHPLFLLCP